MLCTVGILPAMSQQQEKELQLNMDAVKMIQFDFNSLPKQENQPLEAPLNKKWMDFKVDLKVPRSLIDTTKVWKPESYVRMEPYTIWTRFGEDPVYDVLMAGRPKQWKISWTLNPNRIYADEEYGRSIVPSTGRMYESVSSPAGPSFAIGGLDFMGFIYDNMTRRGRMLAHNRKHANAWKTYADHQPTAADSMKVPNFYRQLRKQQAADSTQTLLTFQPAFSAAPLLPVYAVPDSVKKQAEPQPDTVKVEKRKTRNQRRRRMRETCMNTFARKQPRTPSGEKNSSEKIKSETTSTTCSVKSSAYANSRTDKRLISLLEYEIHSQYQAEKCSQVVPFQLHLERNHGENGKHGQRNHLLNHFQLHDVKRSSTVSEPQTVGRNLQTVFKKQWPS